MINKVFINSVLSKDVENAVFLQGILKLSEKENVHIFDSAYFQDVCHQFSVELSKKGALYGELSSICNEVTIDEVIKFCDKATMKEKLDSELGVHSSLSPKRRSYRSDHFESFFPLGLVFHITPANSEGLSFLAGLEAMLVENISIIRVSNRDSDLCFTLFEKLLTFDRDDRLASSVVIYKENLRDENLMKGIIDLSDGISAWGGDQAIESIRSLCPANKRFISWGHKISFSYISQKSLLGNLDGDLFKLAKEIVKFNQEACSAPQVLYVEEASFKELSELASSLAVHLEHFEALSPLGTLARSQQTEVTNISELLKLESSFEEKAVFEGTTQAWKIFVENDPTFKASPLGRTLWVKPISRIKLVKVLRPFRGFLQTAGLVCEADEIFSVANRLLQAGVTRVVEIEQMQNSVAGEAHDGEMALSRFTKRVRVTHPHLKSYYSFDDINEVMPKMTPAVPVMTKAEFQEQKIIENKAQLYFKSGGSSGEPALSTFSLVSYHQQMKAAADGLFAAGLNPHVDSVMNLFFGGGLYGGFLSFFTILEHLEVKQFPMAANPDYAFVAKTIEKNNINVLVGMPSYLAELFSHQKEFFKKQKIISKIFYGGEAFSTSKREWFREEFGVETIRSASYGSVDAGPLGFQCPECIGGVHHLNESIQNLEILKMDEDLPVSGDEVGRLVFTSSARETLKVERYDVGDIGRWVTGKCKCARTQRLFELLGRSSDTFKLGGSFISYLVIQNILQKKYEHNGLLQVSLSEAQGQDHMSLFIAFDKLVGAPNVNQITETLLHSYKDLSDVIVVEKMAGLSINNLSETEMLKTKGSGKLMRVIEGRY